jgi:predicted metal-dependent hydrolase
MLKRFANLLQDKQLSLFEAFSTPPVVPEADVLANPRAERRMRLGEQHVPYELKRARRRSIGFVVGSEGLRVSAPRWLPLADIERALEQKSDWILRKLVEQRERARRVQAARIEWRDGASLPYLGAPLRLSLQPTGDGIQFDAVERVLHVGLPADAGEEEIRAAVQAWLQRSARAFFLPRCAHYAEALGVTMKQLRLSSAQTRWGSASADGSIRLNWRLIHYGPAIIDYVVAHELAHLREMNHSPRFWELVRSVMPDFQQARDALREESIVTE